MKRILVFPMLALLLPACAVIPGGEDSNSNPEWVEERLSSDNINHNAPAAVPETPVDPTVGSELDRQAASVVERRQQLQTRTAGIDAARPDTETFLAEGQARTASPDED